MMILCPNHHREEFLGGMSETEQRRYRANPYNRRSGVAEGALRVFQTNLAVTFGSVQFVGAGTFIQVDDDPLLQLHMGPENTVELSVSLYSREDELLALIERNEWIIGDPLPWDFESSPRRMTVREKSGLISLTIDTREFPIAVKGHLWRKRQHYYISKDEVRFDGVISNFGIVGVTLEGMKLRADTAAQELYVDHR
jgi:hypothetical protein